MNLALVALLALGTQDPKYDTVFLETGARCDHIEAIDLNGDKKPDLVIQNGRDLQLFLQKDGTYTPKPQQVLRLDPTVFLWTFGTLANLKFPVLFTAGSRGIQALPFDGTAFGAPQD